MQSPPQVIQHIVFHPYTQEELVDLGSQFWQKLLESISAWHLCLWDAGMDGIILSESEMGKLASLTIHPALQQRLQNAYQIPGKPFILKWLMATLCTVWSNQAVYDHLWLDGRCKLSSNRHYRSWA